MRKLSIMFFIALLCAALAMAQSSATAPARHNARSDQGQAQSGAQTPITVPRAAGTDRNASQVDRGVPNNPNATNDNQAQAGTPNAPQQTPGATPGAAQRTGTYGSGVPWGWIIVGIIVIAIILALIGRGGSDRAVERREVERDRTVAPPPVPPKRRDDDIRRVG